MKAYREGKVINSHHNYSVNKMEMRGQLHARVALPSRKEPPVPTD